MYIAKHMMQQAALPSGVRLRTEPGLARQVLQQLEALHSDVVEARNSRNAVSSMGDGASASSHVSENTAEPHGGLFALLRELK